MGQGQLSGCDGLVWLRFKGMDAWQGKVWHSRYRASIVLFNIRIQTVISENSLLRYTECYPTRGLELARDSTLGNSALIALLSGVYDLAEGLNFCWSSSSLHDH